MKEVILKKPIINDTDKSILIYKRNSIYKILKKEDTHRENTFFRLGELKGNKSLVLPEQLLFYNNKLVGYKMIYYKHYQVLYNMLKDPNISFEERQSICNKLAKIQEYMIDREYAYFDFHSHNVLFNDGDIKLIDMESGEFKGHYGIYSSSYRYDMFHKYLLIGSKSINALILSVLTGNYTANMISELKSHKKEVLSYVPKELKPLFTLLLTEEERLMSPYEYMDRIDEDFVQSLNLKLKK